MDQIFSLNGKVYKTLLLMTELIEVNILFIIGSIPVITIGASLTSLYTVIVKLHHEKGIRIWKTFWKEYAKNFSRSTILWVLVVGVTVSIFLIYQSLSVVLHEMMILFLPLLAIAAILILATVYIFPLQAYFVQGVLQTISSSLILSVQNVFESIVLFFLFIAVVVIPPLLSWKIWFLWGLFSFSLAAYMQIYLFERVFRKYEQF